MPIIPGVQAPAVPVRRGPPTLPKANSPLAACFQQAGNIAANTPVAAGARLLHAGNQAFKNSVYRPGLHFKSPALRSLLQALTVAQATPASLPARQSLSDKVQAWQRQHPREFAARGALVPELRQALPRAAVAASAGVPLRRQAPAVPVKPGRSGKSVSMLENSMKMLEKMGGYACTDAHTFVRKTRPGYAGIIARLNQYEGNPQRLQANGRAMSQANMAALAAQRGALSSSMLNSVADSVHRAQAGCCTTLAYAAAAELLQHQSGNERVEVVSHQGARGHSQTHCFVVINRVAGSRLDQPQTWGAQAKVIDPWAASIGAPLLGDAAHPPIGNLWPPTRALFDSQQAG